MSSLKCLKMKMKKRVLSILLAVAMVVCLLPMRIHIAEATKLHIKLTVSPDVSEAHPGDDVTFTISIGPIYNLAGLHIRYEIPDGLKYKSFSQILSNQSLNGFIDHNEVKKDIAVTVTSPDTGYTSYETTKLFSITCTVNDDADIFSTPRLTVSDPGSGDFCYDMDLQDISLSIESQSFTITAPPVNPNGVLLDKHELNVTDHTGDQMLTATMTPAGASGTLVWSTSDGNVASVTNNYGNEATVTINGVGTATITVTIQGTSYSDACIVNVSEYDCPHTDRTQENSYSGATCTQAGCYEYYVCGECGKYIINKNNVTVVSDNINDTIIPAQGHDYEQYVYSSDNTQHWQVCSRCYEKSAKENHTFGPIIADSPWSNDYSACTLSHICTVCEIEVSETVFSNSQVVPATCTAGEKTTYTAEFTTPEFPTQTKEVVTSDPLGHDWGAPTYTWSDDNDKCTATRICTRDSSHKEEETVTTSMVIDATCTEPGTKIYTATFVNEAFNDDSAAIAAGQPGRTKNIGVDALGHDYQDFILQEATEERLGSVQKKCSRCGDEGDTGNYLDENTSPSKYSDGTDISDGNTVQLSETGTVELDGEDKEVKVLLQDPLNVFDGQNIVLKILSISSDLGEDYDGNISVEKAYLVDIELITAEDGNRVAMPLLGKVRLLFEIPDDPDNPDDDWYEGGLQVQCIQGGKDLEYIEKIEYQLYDADGNFVKVVDKEYAPQEGETVRKFAVIWTNRSGWFAVIASPRTPLTITAESAEKAYDGSALTKNSYTAEGLAEGDKVENITITGSQTVAGSSNNVPSAAKIVNAKGEDVTAAYDITYVNGTLTVTKADLPTLTNDQKPVPATELKEDGKDQVLVIDPKALPDGYTVEYSTDGGKTWKSVPTGKDSGEYLIQVQYKAKDENHTDFFGEDLKVLIAGEYNPTEGSGEWTKGSKTACVFRFKKAFNDEVFIDGKEAHKDKDYTATKGSTIITFAPEFLETLSTGEHMIKITFKDGESSAVLKVLAPAADTTPTTGDSGMPLLWATMLLISMAGAAVMIERKRRKA